MAGPTRIWQSPSVTSDTVKQLDDVLLRNYVHLEAERGLSTEAWLALLRRRYPEPSFFDFGARRDWRAAFAEAARVPVVRRTIDAVFVPVWICEHQEDSTADEWVAETMLVAADGRHQRFDEHIAGRRVFAAQIERAHRAHVAPSRSYARDIPHLLYNAHHIVLTSEGAERVVSVYGSVDAPEAPRPTLELAPWTSGAEAAVDVSGLDELWTTMAAPDSETYRVGPVTPHWPSLIEAALASERGGPPSEGD